MEAKEARQFSSKIGQSFLKGLEGFMRCKLIKQEEISRNLRFFLHTMTECY